MRSGCVSPRASQSTAIQPADEGPCGFYWRGTEVSAAFQRADLLLSLDVIFREIGAIGLFSDFPAVLSAFVNCVLPDDDMHYTTP